MSHLYFNDYSELFWLFWKGDYSEENTCERKVFRSNIFHHTRKKLNIFTPQMPIYYIQY